MIRFDIDPDEDKKPFQKYIAVCSNVQDAKGNPGSPGQLFLTNLRIIWQMKADSFINVVIGLDAVNTTQIKTTPVQWGNGFKHMLIIKAQNPSQTRYQFRFVGYNSQQVKIFNELVELRRYIKFDITEKQSKQNNFDVQIQQQDMKINMKLYQDNKQKRRIIMHYFLKIGRNINVNQSSRMQDQ